MRLLLVEDDPMIGEAVLDVLRAEHYAVDWVKDGDMADTALRARQYDLVLLDLGLPKRDGLEVLRLLRARKQSVPVLVATALQVPVILMVTLNVPVEVLAAAGVAATAAIRPARAAAYANWCFMLNPSLFPESIPSIQTGWKGLLQILCNMDQNNKINPLNSTS